MVDFTQVLSTLSQGATGRFDQWDGARWHDINDGGGSPTPTVQTLTSDSFLISGGWATDDIISGDGVVIVPTTGEGTITIGVTLTGDSTCNLQFTATGPGEPDANDYTNVTFTVDGDTITYTTPFGDVITQSTFQESALWYPGVEFDVKFATGLECFICFENESGSSDVQSRKQNPRPGPREG